LRPRLHAIEIQRTLLYNEQAGVNNFGKLN
jgi:hypothetical protein